MNTEIVTYELAKIAKEKGFNAKCDYYWQYAKLNKKERSDKKYMSEIIDEPALTLGLNKTDNTHWDRVSGFRHIYMSAPSYHQLIDWVFNGSISFSNRHNVLNFTQSTWLEFWHTIFKNCPLKYEFTGRLAEYNSK